MTSIAAQLRAMRQDDGVAAAAAEAAACGAASRTTRSSTCGRPCTTSTGVDLTAIEGIDEIHALTLVSELGSDFTKWPTVKHFTSWLGLCPNLKKTGGKVKSSRTRRGKGPGGACVAVGGVEPDAVSKSYLGAYLRRQRSRLGSAQGDHGDGAQAGADRVPPDALRARRTCRQDGGGVRGAGAGAVWRSSSTAGREELGYEVKKIEPPPEPPSGMP